MKRIRLLLVYLIPLLSIINIECTDDSNDIKIVKTPILTTSEVSMIQETAAKCGGNITDNGNDKIIERGICYSTSQNPNTANHKIISTSSTDTFSCAITNLVGNTKYYVRAYAINSIRTGYGKEIFFRTLTYPSISTYDPTNITNHTATCGGKVMSDGGSLILERGICFDSLPNPTIEKNKVISTGTLGELSCNLTDLSEYTTYYVRAYATNSVGTNYGNEISFRTISIPLITTTLDMNSIKQRGARSGGIITDDGGRSASEIGICFSTLPNPTIANSKVLANQYNYTYTCNLMGLTPNSNYYIRAYAKNEIGIGYGNEINFKTLELSTPEIKTEIVTLIGYSAAIAGISILNDGGLSITEVGLCASTSPNPTINDIKTPSYVSSGTYEAIISNLLPGTIYYLRAYAINSLGTSYGNEISFSTKPLTCPNLTSVFNNVGRTEASLGGLINENGGSDIIEMGICYSLKQNPTMDDNKVAYPYFGYSFNVLVDSLNVNTKYYFRAYARNSIGVGYGNEISFTTKPISIPGVSTILLSSSYLSAKISVWINDNGGSGIIMGGLCYGTSPNPTTEDNNLRASDPTSSFEIEITNLAENTTYYLRGYAINSIGVAYGNEVSFTTEPLKLPRIITNGATSVSINEAVCGGLLLDNGGDNNVEVGICYGKSKDPTLDNNVLTAIIPNGEYGDFNCKMTNLQANTLYYIRAFARNKAGITYGENTYVKTYNSTTYDIDNNEYNTVIIGNQEWTVENLKTSRFVNGDTVSNITDSDKWLNTNDGAYCWFNNDTNYKSSYGGLYNYYAVVDNRGLCPVGWHVPTKSDIDILINFIGGTTTINAEMIRESGYYWGFPANNITGFTALPGGLRNSSGFNLIGSYGFWWSSTEFDNSKAHYINVYYEIVESVENKSNGYSVRCIKN